MEAGSVVPHDQITRPPAVAIDVAGRRCALLQVGQQSNGVPQQIVLVPLREGTPAFPTERFRRPLHHVGIEMAPEDFENERERLQGLGFDVRLGEHPFLSLKGMYLDDPDGNEIELIAMKT